MMKLEFFYIQSNQDLGTPPVSPPLLVPRNTVHIWQVNSELLNTSFQDKEFDCLSEQERQKAEAYYFDRDKIRYRIAHIALRKILSLYTQIDPAKLNFTSTPLGKPHLHPNNQALSFNLSDSHHLVMLAVTYENEVGLDV